MLTLGVNPDKIKGSKTGVFIGCSASEAHDAWSCDPEKTVGYSMTGCTRSMFANRISYFFDFKGQKLGLLLSSHAEIEFKKLTNYTT